MNNSITLFLRRNAGVLYGVLAVFILAQGVAVFSYPKYWWVPLACIPLLALVALVWHNHKVVVKLVITGFMLLVASSFLMLSATSYSNDIEKGLMVPLGMLTGTCAFIFLTYLYDFNVSRWIAAQIGIIGTFALVYAFIPLGTTAMMIAAIAGIVIIGSIWITVIHMAVSRNGNMPARPRALEDYRSRRLAHILGSEWDVVTIKCRYPFYVAIHHHDNKTCAFVPLTFSTHMVDERRRGLTYRHRRIGQFFYKIIAYVRRRTFDSTVIVIADWMGASESYDIIALPIADSMTAHEYIQIVDMSQSNKSVQNDIIHSMETFDYRGLSDRQIKSFRKRKEVNNV